MFICKPIFKMFVAHFRTKGMLNHDEIIFAWGWYTAWYVKNLLLKDLAYRVNVSSKTNQLLSLYHYTITVPSFLTGRSRQTVLIQIRLPLQEQSDQGLHCLPFRLHLLGALPGHKTNCSTSRLITANFSGVWIFRCFTVVLVLTTDYIHEN